MGPRTMTSVADVPFLDLAAQHAEIADELDEAWAKVTSTNGFIGGSYVADFEAEYAEYCGVTECIGVANGTDALELILRGLGIGPRATRSSCPPTRSSRPSKRSSPSGATPVFVDVDDDTLLVAAAHIEAAITRTHRRRDRRAPLRADARHGRDQRGHRQGRHRAHRGRGPGAGRALARRAAPARSASPPRSASTRARTSARSATPARSPPTTPTLTRKIRSFADHGRRVGTRARARATRTQQPPRRAPGRDPVDQARAPRRLERVAACRGRPVPHAPGRLQIAGCSRAILGSTPVHHLEIVRVPHRGSGVERTRRARNRLGSPLSDSDAITRRPSSVRTCAVHPVTETRRRRDRFRSDVPDDHPSRSRTRLRSTGRRNPREREWNWKLRDTAPNRTWTPVGPGAAGDRRGRDVPVEAAADHSRVVDALHRVRTRSSCSAARRSATP